MDDAICVGGNRVKRPADIDNDDEDGAGGAADDGGNRKRRRIDEPPDIYLSEPGGDGALGVSDRSISLASECDADVELGHATHHATAFITQGDVLLPGGGMLIFPPSTLRASQVATPPLLPLLRANSETMDVDASVELSTATSPPSTPVTPRITTPTMETYDNVQPSPPSSSSTTTSTTCSSLLQQKEHQQQQAEVQQPSVAAFSTTHAETCFSPHIAEPFSTTAAESTTSTTDSASPLQSFSGGQDDLAWLDCDPMFLSSLFPPQPRAAELPPTWEPCPRCDLHMEDAPHLGEHLSDETNAECHVVSLSPDSAEFAAVAGPIRAHGMEVVSVQRVQNHTLATKYSDAKRISHAVSEHDTLYHMSRADATDILLQGLDQRLSRVGLFGRGIYFTDHPLKANMYYRGPTDAVRFMFRATVQLGRVKEYLPGQSDQSLLREPRGFHSVKGDLSGHAEYVVYDSSRVRLDYVIGYTVPETVQRAAMLTALVAKWGYLHPGVAPPRDAFVAQLGRIGHRGAGKPSLPSLLPATRPALVVPSLPTPPISPKPDAHAAGMRGEVMFARARRTAPMSPSTAPVAAAAVPVSAVASNAAVAVAAPTTPGAVSHSFHARRVFAQRAGLV